MGASVFFYQDKWIDNLEIATCNCHIVKCSICLWVQRLKKHNCKCTNLGTYKLRQRQQRYKQLKKYKKVWPLLKILYTWEYSSSCFSNLIIFMTQLTLTCHRRHGSSYFLHLIVLSKNTYKIIRNKNIQISVQSVSVQPLSSFHTSCSPYVPGEVAMHARVSSRYCVHLRAEVQLGCSNWIPSYCLWAKGACLINGRESRRDMLRNIIT